MKYALEEFIIEGIPTTVGFHRKIFNHPDFISGDFDTSFIQKMNEKIRQTESEVTKIIDGNK